MVWALFSKVNFIFILFQKCLQYLDVSVLGELVPRLCELIRSGVGLGTKVRKCIFHKSNSHLFRPQKYNSHMFEIHIFL